jgi:hypothetical protein
MNCKNCGDEILSVNENFCSRKCYELWRFNSVPVWTRVLKNWTIVEFSHKTAHNTTIKRVRYYWKVKCNNCDNENVRNADLVARDTVCQNCKNRPKGESGLLALYHIYDKCCAGSRNIEFNLNMEEFKKLTSDRCHYCGRLPYKTTNGGENEWGKYIYNGIDQINPCQGYKIGNVVSCCEICNVGKSDRGYQEFIEYLNALVAYRTSLKS